MNNSLRGVLLLTLLFARAYPALSQEQSASLSAHEQIQDCLRELWGQPVFWDSRAVAPVDPSLCKVPQDKMEAALQQQHIISFRLPNAVLLASESAFRQESGPFRYEWKTPAIKIRVLPRVTPGSRKPTEAELHEFAEVILKHSHLAPLTCPFKASEGQPGRLAFNIFVEIHKMHPGADQESVVVLLADSDAEQETVLGAGRLLYGELQEGRLRFRWESPLLETAMSKVGFVDLLGGGNLQIMLTSVFGMGNHTALYVFDLNGREISRQASTCEAFADWDRHSAVACPIATETDIEIKGGATDPKDLVATEASGKKVRYVFKEGHYQEAPALGGRRPPSVPRATAFNDQGIELMQQKNYEAAIEKFEEAAQANDKDPQFANNAGFAYFKLGRYQDSLYWFNKAIEINPNRAIAYLNLGDAYANLNNYGEARRTYEKYLQLAPNSSVAPDVKKKIERLQAKQSPVTPD